MQRRSRFPLLSALFILAPLAAPALRADSVKAPTTESNLDSQKRVLEKSDSLILYSINSDPPKKGADNFRGYTVAGQCEVKAETKQQLIETLFNSIAQRKRNDGVGGARCFIPHHGLRGTVGKRTVDVVICFSCGHAYFFENENRRYEPVGGKPRKFFNKILTDANVPLTDDKP